MSTYTQPNIDYDTLLAHIQTFEIPILDFVNHLKCSFNIEDVIGNGGVMTVYNALLRYNPQQESIKVALKIPKKTVKETSRDKVINHMLAAIRQEIRMMKSLEEDPHIVTLYGVAFRDLKPVLVMELATSSLNDYLITNKDTDNPVAWETKARFCYEVAEGIKSLHSVNIVHGDIKADNILLFGNPAEEDKLIAKLSDFGYSSTMASIARGDGTGGTPNFWAPECTPKAPEEMKLYANKPTKDIYSYGLLVWQVAADGGEPYEDMSADEIDKAKHTDRLLLELMDLLPEDTPESFRKLIISMTKYVPDEREDLMNVRTIISGIGDFDLSKDIRYTEAKEAFETSTKNLPTEMGGVKLKSLRSMPIPPSIKKRLFRTYEAAAAKGDAEAAYFLSVCYGSEFGVKLDKTKMISWAIEAAKGGNFEGVKNIATFYGMSTAQLPDNITLLYPWILKIAEAGHKNSQYFVSQCYKNGICVEEDVIKYWEWYRKYQNNYDPTPYEKSLFPEESALDCAVREGNIEAIRFFLQENMDINAKNSSGFTPLLLAATYNHTEVIKMLVTEFGADMNIRSTEDWTPLHLAAAGGAFETVELLVVNFGVDVNVQSDDGWTPFHLAAQNGHINTARLLAVNLGADTNTVNNKSITPLHSAAKGGNTGIVELLVVRFGVNVNITDGGGTTPLYCATLDGHFDTVKLLLAAGADVNRKDNNGWVPLHIAAEKGHIDIAQLLVMDYGADVNIKNEDGSTPLYQAARYGQTDMVKLLTVDLGADVNTRTKDGWTPFHIASHSGYIEIARLFLIKFGADVNSKMDKGWAPLHLAAGKGNIDTMKLLMIEFGADVNARNSQGWTPIHQASQGGHIDAVKLLIESGADINAKSDSQWTSFHSAACKNHINLVKLFVQLGADTNDKTASGQTSLHLVASDGYVDLARFLVVELSADVNVKDNDGSTPLHLAASNGHVNIVKILVEFGANINVKNNDEWTPLHQAARAGHVDIVKLLVVEFKADINVEGGDGFISLHLAAYEGNTDILKLLLAKPEAKVNSKASNGYTPLHLAVEIGNIDAVKSLVAEFGANVNAKADLGWTPLHSAVAFGHVDIVKLLVNEFEADMNARSYLDRIPLLCNSNQTSNEIALTLLEHPRANINEKTEDGQTLLHLAVKYRQEVVVKILVEKFHLDINAKDSKGQTPLDLAGGPPVHFGYGCDGCRQDPIIGEHYKCTVCDDFDFCSTCYSTVDHYNRDHTFKTVELPEVKHLLVPN